MADNNASQERISQKLAPSSEKKGMKGKMIGLIVGLVALIVVIAIVVVLVIPKDTPKSSNTVVTPENVDEVLAELSESEKQQPGQYEATMNSTWEFETGGSSSTNAYVENSTSNTNDVYFDVVRSDTEETILTSPTIPVGSHLAEITLDEDLDAGSYPCVLTYYLLDEDGNTTSQVSINITINVHN